MDLYPFKLSKTQEDRARAVHRDALVVDMLWSTNPAQPTPSIDGKDALTRVREAGLHAANNTLAGVGETFRDATREMALVYRLIENRPSEALLVETSEDIVRAKREGKLGIILGFQNAEPLEDDWISTMPILHKLGLRITSVTYNLHNLLGDGATEPHDNGLTAYGLQVVGGLNKYGIMIDLSHVGWNTAMDTVKASHDPVVASHSNVFALTEHPRNIKDDLIKAIGDNGGVIGIVAWNVICAARHGTPMPTIEDYLDHVDYVKKLIGVDHVGIGSDINENFRAMPIRSDFETAYSFQLKETTGPAPAVVGFDWEHDILNVTRGLVARGYTDDEIVKVLGGNFMRVARKVWDKKRTPARAS